MNILQSFHKEVGTLVKKNIWDTDLPKVRIEGETRDFVKKHSNRIRGSVRLRRGLFYTDDESIGAKKRLRRIKLP